MSERRLFLDIGVGETRGVVVGPGGAERLLVDRGDDIAVQALGARVAARVRRVDRALGLAFLDLGDGPDAVLNLRPEMERIAEGEHLDVEIRSEGRGDKGANVRLEAKVAGPIRLLQPAPDLESRLQAFAPRGRVVTGAAARAAADEAQDEALATLFALPGGGEVAIERTRALTAVDIDIGERAGGDAKRVTRAANLAAIALAARVLRLKGQGGLVVIDLAGRGHDGAALLAAARQAFAPDNPGVALGPISRFGTLELTVPRRARPVLELLADVAGRPTVRTTALALVRALEREAGADGGARLEAAAHPGLASAAAPLVEVLKRRIGARVAVRADDAVAPGAYVIRPL